MISIASSARAGHADEKADDGAAKDDVWIDTHQQSCISSPVSDQ
jgi:hypothetical protein